MRVFRLLFTLYALCVVMHSSVSRAEEPIRFPRHPSLSPNGMRIAFSWQGDIWTVSSDGGIADRLTVHESHDQMPAWSPDGNWIAFSSRREGNYDIYVMPAKGGSPRRMTYHSADDLCMGWSKDGRSILFASAREQTRSASTYILDIGSGATRLAAFDDVLCYHASFSADGRTVFATRGGSFSRKGYRGSGQSDLLAFPTAGGPAIRITHTPENERWPIACSNGKLLYYVSDSGGAANLWSRSLIHGTSRKLTAFTEGNVMYPTLSLNEKLIVFERDLNLYRYDVASGVVKKLEVYCPTDSRTNPVRHERYTIGVQDYRISSDGKRVVFVVHGEVWVKDIAGGDPKRITNTPQREEDPGWTPDGKQVVFTSDRTGEQRIYIAGDTDKSVRQLVAGAVATENTPVVSPDGRRVAYLEGYNGSGLCVTSISGGPHRTLFHHPDVNNPVWSPDSQWIAFGLAQSHSAGSLSDIYIVNVDTGKLYNVSRYPVVNSRPVWSPDGKRLYYLSNRSTIRQVWSVTLEDEVNVPEAAATQATGPAPRGPGAPPGPGGRGRRNPGGPSPNSTTTAIAPSQVPSGPAPSAPPVVKIDVEDIHKRVRQVTRGDSDILDFALSPDSRSVVYVSSQLGSPGLWRVGADGGASTQVLTLGSQALNLQFAPDGSRVYFLSGGVIGFAGFTPTGVQPGSVALDIRMNVDSRDEMVELFDEAWRKMRDSFYDEKMHGVDWKKVRNNYRPAAHHLIDKADFAALFTLMLGELNASHTGITPPVTDAGPATPSLGVTLDDHYVGPGVMVRTVMPRGPADRPRSRLQAGDIILKVNGETVTVNERFYELITVSGLRSTELTVNTEPREFGARTVTLTPISLAAYKRLEYERWMREKERVVLQASDGKFAYIHLDAMLEEQLERFKRDALGDFNKRKGLILDLRFNGGGSIADEIMNIIENRIMGYRTLRGENDKLPAPMPALAMPIVVMTNEASFSNAEVFPYGFRSLKLGKIVGMPTHGSVIGTGATTLLDGTVLRTPVVGSFTLDGKNMENNGCKPDIQVEHTPEDVFYGRDRQLETAIAELSHASRVQINVVSHEK